ncbi:chloride channel [Dipodascopsis tothii]|uniref:chloride channel n=1 Tax=Dipodascopsis tothii TaxID=44089 RepID=UPI0034CF2522
MSLDRLWVKRRSQLNTEGSGRRTGENLVAIDWTEEHIKDRERAQQVKATALAGGPAGGLAGAVAAARPRLVNVLDSAQVWTVLVATGLMAGVMASVIDVVTNWMDDLKIGHCATGFYLSREFCCLGTAAGEQCTEWRPWTGAAATAAGFVGGYAVYIALAVAFAALSAFLVLEYAPYAAQSGIPEMKTVLAGFVMADVLGPWTLLVKALALCLSAASGLWVGKEGPLVHVACCCGAMAMAVVGRLPRSPLANEARKREVLSAAAAAGITVAFGAPVAGVLFSLEQMSAHFPDKSLWQSLACCMVGSVAMQIVNPFRTGTLAMFQLLHGRPWHKFELVPFALVGVLGGVFGAAVIRLNMAFARLRTRNRLLFEHPLAEVVGVALLTALLNFPSPLARLGNNVQVFHMLRECETGSLDELCGSRGSALATLAYICLTGVVLLAYTFGTNVPAGALMPTMAIGAAFGRVVGLAMEALQAARPDLFLFAGACHPDRPCVTAGIYAVVGAAAALGGVTRLTVSVVVIMFELTGALTYVLPIMVAVMVATWTAQFLDGHRGGIYEAWIHFREYPSLPDVRDGDMPDMAIGQLPLLRDRDTLTLPGHGMSLDDVAALLRTTDVHGFPVVRAPTDRTLVGYVARSQLEPALRLAHAHGHLGHAPCVFAGLLSDATDPDSPYASTPTEAVDMRMWVDRTAMAVSHRASFALVVDLFRTMGLRAVLLTRRGELDGIVTRKDICRELTHGIVSKY